MNSEKSVKNTITLVVSQLLTIFIGMIKSKSFALIIGPRGIGVLQLLSSLFSILNTVGGMGLSFSSVRSIAGQSNNRSQLDTMRVALLAILASSIIFGSLGVALASQLSVITFGDDSYSNEVILLVFAGVLVNVAGVLNAFFKANRESRTILKVNFIIALTSGITSIGLVYWFKEGGLVFTFVFLALTQVLVNFLFLLKNSRLSLLDKIFQRFKWSQVKDLIRVGGAKMSANLVNIVTLYILRLYIAKEFEIEVLGYFAVASTLSITYTGILFNSLANDYFPRVSAIINRRARLIREINWQTGFTLILGTPLIVVMCCFSEFFIELLYSEEFTMGSSLLKLMIVAAFIRLLTSPLAYVILAEGLSGIYFLTQLMWNLLFLALIFIFSMIYQSFEVIGYAYLVAGVMILLMNYLILKVRILNKEVYSWSYLMLYIICSLLVGASLLISIYFDNMIYKVAITMMTIFYCLKIGVGRFELIKLIKS